MQQRGGESRLGSGCGTAADLPMLFRSFIAYAVRRMSIVDDITARVFSQSAMPERTGRHAVGTARLRLSPQATEGGPAQRPITVQLWYPVDEDKVVHTRSASWLSKILHPTRASAYHRAPLTRSKATFPFIVYVPDKHGHHDDNTFTLANLASHGFILAAVDDPYRNVSAGAARAVTHALRTTGSAHDQSVAVALHDGQIARGAATASALLDALEALTAADGPGAWAERLNLKQVGILGYAMGGVVAAEAAVADRRFGVVASLDGIRSGPSRVKVPYLLMLRDLSLFPAQLGAQKDADGSSRAEDYRHAEYQAALPESHVFEVCGTRHEHFTDRLIFPSRPFTETRHPSGFKRIRAIIDSYTVAFFTTYLRADPHPLMCVRHSPYPEVHFVMSTDEYGAWAQHEPAGRG